MKRVLFFGLLAMVGLSACGESQELKDKRAFVTQALSDPASAQFRNEVHHSTGWLCGEVNAKNAMGGYTGFKRFAAKNAGNTYLEDVGSLNRQSTLEQDLDLELEALKEARSHIEVGELERSAAQEWVKARVFEKRWQAACS